MNPGRPKLTNFERGQRRREILKCAVAIAERDGLHALTTQSLADEKHMGVRTIYHYFDSFDELLALVVEKLCVAPNVKSALRHHLGYP